MKRLREERGAAAVALLVVLAAVGVSTVLLWRTMSLANSINDKAQTILTTGRGINAATDAVVQLNETNDLAGSILDTARPLEGKLDRIVGLASQIDKLAVSINGTATTVNGTASGINSSASRILSTARSIDSGVARINANLEVTISLARLIKGDTGNILGQAHTAHGHASTIDRKSGGPNDGHGS